MRTRSEKRPNRKNDRKVLVAEESNKNWVDSDSDSTSSSSSSSDIEPEEVHCLMANQTTNEDELFDFSNTEFTREDLINTLNEMVHEYRKLSQTFEEVKAENKGLKNSSVEPSTAQLGETNSLKTELSFNAGESSSRETSTQSDLASDKFKKMNFVKASMIQNAYESVKYDDQTSGQLNQKGKAGIGYIRPENYKPSWLNRLVKDKAKAGSKSYVPNQSKHGSKKVKSVWVKVLPQRDLNGPHTKPKL
ncbi:hypothetical protein F511_41816 [Dorcoceras hygrometricum]|uniref:Uncharacterized protein n=1 Tax=Dorcoceras hygrometricum TaxID=472368 RepID=A0A2Z7CLR8_9LAMI|nr:hypothetical protein F511_41816 [Dorcoceras hygrometricum]